MKRPYVICHMAPSIDGRIVTTRWPATSALTRAYERTAASFDADGWIIGRISMEPYAGRAKLPASGKRPRKIARTDYVAPHTATSFAIAIDPSGKLRWTKSDIDGEHVITVVTQRVSDAYLAFLQDQGISYVFGGKTTVNLKRVLYALRSKFGIKKLLLEGGGKINGSFLSAQLIDELSVLVAPVADGTIGTPSLFDVTSRATRAHSMKLVSCEKRSGDIVWLRYKLSPRA